MTNRLHAFASRIEERIKSIADVWMLLYAGFALVILAGTAVVDLAIQATELERRVRHTQTLGETINLAT
jgi:hypothetical protein